jgi:murein DD-endopeptidase MepM/ murein hydrolase activator NlpD
VHSPLNVMRIRRESPNNTFGMVRNHGTRAHQGWDLAAPIGTPIYAVGDGHIRDLRDEGDYGLSITLEFQHAGQTLFAFYAHLSLVLCRTGQHVREGEMLGCTGRTGNARKLSIVDEHLHFEIRMQRHPGHHLDGRIDPGELLGYQYYSSSPPR